RGPVRWPVRAGDDGTPERKCRRPVHRVQAAERGGTGPPSVEDALGGSAGVPEESAPCRGPGPPAADRVDGLPPVAAAVSAARRRRRPPTEKRTTTETILRAFQGYTLWLERHPCGRIVRPTELTAQQRQILQRLHFPTPAQFLAQKLPHLPP